MTLPGTPRAPIDVSAAGRRGELLVRGLFGLVRVELVDGKRISILARAEDGRRVTIGIPCELLEDIGPADTTEPPPQRRARLSLVLGAP
ncbi:MAG: hypothetical protein WA719_08190 [Thermoplasmata archaeon]